MCRNSGKNVSPFWVQLCRPFHLISLNQNFRENIKLFGLLLSPKDNHCPDIEHDAIIRNKAHVAVAALVSAAFDRRALVVANT